MSKDELLVKIKEILLENTEMFKVTNIYKRMAELKDDAVIVKDIFFGILIDIEDLKEKREEKNLFNKDNVYLSNFIKKMEEYFTLEELAIMYGNLIDLQIKKADLLLLLVSIKGRLGNKKVKAMTGGAYSHFGNKLLLYSVDNEKISKLKVPSDELYGNFVYTHELLHMCSSKRNQEGFLAYASGFSKGNWKYGFGISLNEGYTEVLNLRIFGHSTNGIYIFYRIIAEEVEAIVGRETMQHLYLTANSDKLIDILAKYSSKKKACEFINKIDTIEKKPEVLYDIIQYLADTMDAKINYNKEKGILIDEKIEAHNFRLFVEELVKLHNKTFKNEERMVVDDHFLLGENDIKKKAEYPPKHLSRTLRKGIISINILSFFVLITFLILMIICFKK